ncbi:amidohydrolase family protein [Saccharopolyspora erythraea]|uniref:amidohydrolase family protein n=1 Tax=Saccharopolyspora erythraea TaxID=1836 RepID=UPI001BAAF937|nr:amidohydrolase family protein [Saccharopolyspora erythraea]QUH04290.1 amidohydrolase family protein [Saccharopolyspora erythraea]
MTRSPNGPGPFSRRGMLGAAAATGLTACTPASTTVRSTVEEQDAVAASGGPLLLRGAMLADGRRTDILLDQGRIAAVDAVANGAPELDLTGYLLLPSAVETHAHLDKALLGDRVPNPAGDLDGAKDAISAAAAGIPDEDVRARASAALEMAVRHGYTAVRSHADTGKGNGLRGLRVLLELRERFADVVDLQVVCFVGPVSGASGAEARRLLDEGLRMGADAVGGVPYVDPDPAQAVREYLAAAREHGKLVDLHTDETTDPAVLSLRELAAETARTGMGGRVTASHCVSLGQQDPATARQVAAEVAAAGVAVVTLPQTNLYLQGRQAGTRVPRALTAVEALREAGAVLAGGGDNWRDPFNAVGRADPFEIASLLVSAGHFTPADAYEAVTGKARQVLGHPPVRIRPGDPAELMAVRAGDLGTAVAQASQDRAVFHRGRLVARTRVAGALHRAR